MSGEHVSTALPEDSLDALVAVLDAIRSGRGRTRPEVARLTNLGRSVVAQRTAHLLACGLVAEDTFAESTGGRPARSLRFRAEAGTIVAVELGLSSLAVGLTDLAGELLVNVEESCDFGDGPSVVLARVAAIAADLLTARGVSAAPVWGVGIGMPGPVDAREGHSTLPSAIPGWNGFPVREYFSRRFGAPVWVDNDVNVMAIGERRVGRAKHDDAFVFLKVGTHIGAGIVANGAVHRGASGAAGEISHTRVVDDPDVVCSCGRTGCLDAVAGGAGLGRLAHQLAATGASPSLARLADDGAELTAKHLAEAMHAGDAAAAEAFERAGRALGVAIVGIVEFFNPSLVIVGGGVAEAGDRLLASIRRTVDDRAQPVATRGLRIVLSDASDRIGLLGAAFAVIDELFARSCLSFWIDEGTPSGHPELVQGRPPAS